MRNLFAILLFSVLVSGCPRNEEAALEPTEAVATEVQQDVQEPSATDALEAPVAEADAAVTEVPTEEAAAAALAAETVVEEETAKAHKGLQAVGGCLGCKSCKSAPKMMRCTATIGVATAACVETEGAACVPAVKVVSDAGCCACLPGPLQTICNALK